MEIHRAHILLLGLWLFLGGGAIAQTPAVKRAYQAIPHRYTPFSAQQARMSAAESAYLTQNFDLVNEAVAARVTAMRSKGFASYDEQASTILASLNAQKPPRVLVKYHTLVIGAIEDQRAYFQAWRAKPNSPFNASDPLVLSASQKLKSAYGLLLKQFPDQAKQVQDAFFDHLCALDFI
jgi:hypothetical protein